MKKTVAFITECPYIKNMMRTKENEMIKFERDCYGMTVEDINANLVNGITTRLAGIEMTIMSILSDAQQVLEFGDSEQARKYINVAKFMISEQAKKKAA